MMRFILGVIVGVLLIAGPVLYCAYILHDE